MKKRFLFLLTLCFLFGSGGLAEAPALTDADFVLVYDRVSYTLRTDPSALLAAVARHDGAEMQLEEADSCLFDGKDKEYYGDELILGTYPVGKGGTDVLESIVIAGGPWETARGIRVGSSRQDVLAAYGAAVQDYDQWLYALGEPYRGPTLIFQFDLETDRVICIFLLACSA